MRHRTLIATSVISVAVVLLLAACGGSSSGPRAAHLGGAASPAAGSGSIGSGPAGQIPDFAAKLLKYAACMREHGVPNFPDPSASRGFTIPIDRSSPAWVAAQATCRKLLPNGGPPGPGSATHPSADALASMLTVSECMRRHGIHEFPDPRSRLPLHPGPGRDHRHEWRSDPGVPVRARHAVTGVRASGGRVQSRDPATGINRPGPRRLGPVARLSSCAIYPGSVDALARVCLYQLLRIAIKEALMHVRDAMTTVVLTTGTRPHSAGGGSADDRTRRRRRRRDRRAAGRAGHHHRTRTSCARSAPTRRRTRNGFASTSPPR